MFIEKILSYLASRSSRRLLPSSKHIPNGGGVYCFWDGDKCLYAGMSDDDLRGRIDEHIRGAGNKSLGRHIGRRNLHVQFSYQFLRNVGHLICNVESAAIDRFNPAYNERRPSCNT